MKKLLLIILTFSFVISCIGPKPKEINTENLENIVTEIFLANSMVQDRNLSEEDSIDIYEPIFNKYGHTGSDMFYTIKMMTRRKSARFSDIIESVISKLEAQNAILTAQVRDLDTTNARILRQFTQDIYSVDSILIKNVSDTSKASFKIPARPGTYIFSVSYFLDSTDHNRSVHIRYSTQDTLGKNTSVGGQRLITKTRKTNVHKITVDDNSIDSIYFRLADYLPEKMSKPNLRFDSLNIKYTPPIEIAKDSFMRKVIDITSLFDRYYINNEKDSNSLHIDSTGLETTSDSLL